MAALSSWLVGCAKRQAEEAARGRIKGACASSGMKIAVPQVGNRCFRTELKIHLRLLCRAHQSHQHQE